MQLTVSAFALGAPIPLRNTCDAENVSPALAWSGVPTGARSLAIVVDDPDAPGGTWVHWLAWGLPPTSAGLPEGVPADTPSPVQGTTSFKSVGWGGPCPPKGHGAHRYFFRLYALDTAVALPRGATRAELDLAMKGHVLASAEHMGKYWRDR